MKQSLLLAIIATLFFACGEPEPPLILSEGKIYDAFHAAKTGDIEFLTSYIPYKEFGAEDFIEEIDLDTTKAIYIRMYLGKTLTAYLHDIAPGKTVEELCDAGNFHFSFYVDGKKAYELPINTGAGSCSYRNEETVYFIPLKTEEDPNHWGQFTWLKFMKLAGGEDLMAKGEHVLRMEVRAYQNEDAPILSEVLAAGEINLFHSGQVVKIAGIQMAEISPTPHFPVAEQTINRVPMEQMKGEVVAGKIKDLTSVTVLKNGELVVEEYFNGADRETLHDTRSVGKTFAGTIMGIAISEGHINSTDQPLSDFYNTKHKTTIQQLLTMTASIDGNDLDLNSPGQEEKMYPTKDWVQFGLSLPERTTTDWSYISAGTILLGDILHQRVPGGLEEYAKKKLFEPLGIDKYQWAYTPTGVPNTAGSLALTSLGLAKFGQLYSDGGRDILSADWVANSLSPLVPRNDEKGGSYGYLLWHDTIEFEGQKYTYAFASGNGGNKVVIFHDLPVVVVITATAYGKLHGHLQADRILKKFVLPAIIDRE